MAATDRDIIEILIGKMGLTSLDAKYDNDIDITKLILSDKNLSQLPRGIGQLSSLQHLDLDGNQLSQLPPEIGHLTSLQTLFLNNNPSLQSPPPEIVAQGTPAILAYLRGLLEKTTARYEAKLLIVGEGGTGKSSLLRALRNQDLTPHYQPHTESR